LPRAYVTLRGNVTPSDEVAKQIMKYVADQVVPYKQLRSIRFIDVIPKSPAGKILRRLLRDAAQEEEKNTTNKPRL
jgi:4-coumarate--CoA ligase